MDHFEKAGVTNPTAGDVHVNQPLTNFSQKYLMSADMFIASRAMPNLPVAKQSDLYYEFDRGDFYRDEAEERADGAESAGGGFSLSTSPYFARVYAYHKDVTDRQRANQDSPVSLEQSATQWVTHKMLIRREKLFIDTYMAAAAAWTSDDGGVTKWDNLATSTPISDVRGAIETVQGLTGYRPNKMLIGRPVFNLLMDSDDILSRITGGANNALPAQVQRQLLAQLFELDEIFVAESVVNSGAKGAADSIAFAAPDTCVVYYAPNSVGLEEPTAGVQFSWNGLFGATPAGGRISRFRMEHLKADRIEAEYAFDYKLTGADLGYQFTNLIT